MLSRERWTSNSLCCELCSIKFATRSAAAALIKRHRGFCCLRLDADDQSGHALIRTVLHKGFGVAAVRSPGFLEGAILDWRAGARTRHNRNFNRQQPPTYGAKP